MALELDVSKAEALVQALISGREGGISIRDKLIAFAETEGIPL
jgi:hypothetical protein